MRSSAVFSPGASNADDSGRYDPVARAAARRGDAVEFYGTVCALFVTVVLVGAAFAAAPQPDLVISRLCVPLVETCELPALSPAVAVQGAVVVSSLLAPWFSLLFVVRRQRAQHL